MRKIAEKLIYMVMDKQAREEVVKVVSCRDGRELFRIANKRVGEKNYAVGVCCLKDESGVVKVWMIERKSGRSIWKS